MNRSLLSKVSVAVLVIVVGLALLSGNTGQVYAYPCHHSNCYNNWWGGYGGGGLYSYYYPYYYSYYYPYYSSYYGNYGSYPYSYGNYGYNSYGYNSYGYNSYGYNQQYQLTVNANPSTLSNAVTGAGQYTQGTSASFAASQNTVQVSQDTRYVFSQWSGDYSGSSLTGSLTMNAAKSVTAVYQLQYYLSVSVQPSSAGALQGSGWFNGGTSAVLSVPSQVISGNSRSRLIFSGWSVDGSMSQTGSALTVQMNAPHTVVAQYNQQYYLNVSSDQGSVSGGGWYDAGTNAQISTSTPPSPSYGISMVFNGWQGDLQSSSQSSTVLMDGPKSVTATWRADSTALYLTVALVVAAIAVAAWISAYMWGRRGRTGGTQWQSTQTQQTAIAQPSPTTNLESTPNAHLNQASDVQSPVQSPAHKRRRAHTTVPAPESSTPEETDTSKTEG